MTPKLLIIGIGFLVVLYALGVMASGLGWNPIGRNWSFTNSGAFGDSFGPLSTFMAAFAAVSAWMAYSSQSEELTHIKKDSDKERTLAKKRDFETTFFNLLELLRGTVQELSASDTYSQNPTTGRAAIKQILESHLIGCRKGNATDKQLYEKVYGLFRDELGHYFRTLYHVIKYVHESEVTDKKMYIQLLRATLSNAEMVIIGLNCMYGGGRQKLKPLVEEHALLHNISSSYAFDWELTKQFAPSAFGDRTMKADGKLSS